MANRAIPARYRVSIPDAARSLGRTHFWVWSRVMRGRIRGEREGSRWVVEQRDVRRFLADQQQQAKAAS